MNGKELVIDLHPEAIAAISALFAADYLIIQRKSKREHMEYDYDKLD